MNNHISDCRTGNTTDQFDLHVHDCVKQNNLLEEPFFQIYAFFSVSEEKYLIPYERYLHTQKFDTMN